MKKTLTSKLDHIRAVYIQEGRIKILTDDKPTATGRSYRIRVANTDIRYRRKADRDKDVKELRDFIWGIHEENKTQNAGL